MHRDGALTPTATRRSTDLISAVWPGEPYPRGATWDGEGVNFSLFSANSDKVELCLFDAAGRHEVQRIELRERTDEHLALLPARGASRAALRLPRPRPLRSRAAATASTRTSC